MAWGLIARSFMIRGLTVRLLEAENDPWWAIERMGTCFFLCAGLVDALWLRPCAWR